MLFALSTAVAQRVNVCYISSPMTKVQRAAKALIDKHKGLRAAARATGLDPGYLSRLRNKGKNNPGQEVMTILGIERRITYHRTIE